MSIAPSAGAERGGLPGGVSFGVRVLAGMLIGGAVGLALGERAAALEPIGDLFIRLLVLAAIPLIFFNLLHAVAGLTESRGVGRLALRIGAYFVSTTVLALTIGLVTMHLLQPGAGVELAGANPESMGRMPEARDVLLGMIPGNAVAAFAEGHVTQIVVLALLLGVATWGLADDQRAQVRSACATLCAWMRRVVVIVLVVAPLGVGALAAVAVGRHGATLAGPVATFVGGVFAGQLAMLLVYCLLLWVFARKAALEFLRQASPALATAAGTASSLATLPVSLDVAERRLGLPRHVIAFTLPLGAQLNKDGTALFLTAMLMFSAQAAGVEFSLAQYLTILLVGLLISEGSNGIPGGGLVVAFVFVEAFGLPQEMVAIVAGIFHLLDVSNTTLNCTGDLVGSVIVARFEPAVPGGVGAGHGGGGSMA